LADITRDEPAVASEDAASTSMHRVLEPDPLVEAVYECAGSPALLISVDPMLDELAALLVTGPRAARAPGWLLEG
jgi:hypothetical protein